MILYCHCQSAQLIPQHVQQGVLRRLVEAQTGFAAVPDLCGVAACSAGELRQYAEAGEVRVAACFPRAVRNLFAAAGVAIEQGAWPVANLREESPEEALRILLDGEPPPGGGVAAEGRDGDCQVTIYDAAEPRSDGRPGLAGLIAALLDAGLGVTLVRIPPGQDTPWSDAQFQAEWTGGARLRRTARGGDLDWSEVEMPQFLDEVVRVGDQRRGAGTAWPPWFPVLDRQRCTGCRQCLNFCLFDVYAVDDEGCVAVRNPTHCKNQCPACARVCPQAAIIFPKYAQAPINGAEVDAAALRQEAMQADLPLSLGGGTLDALRQRSEVAKKRFSRERDQERGLTERCNCLTQLQDLGVPAEVIVNLSLDEVRAKAAQKLASHQRAGGEPGDHACS